MTRRRGHIYRIHDFGPFTIACCGSFFADGPHRWPVIDLIFRDRWSRSNGRGGRATLYRRAHLPLPFVRWSTAYRLRRVGMIRIYRAFCWSYRRAFYVGGRG